MFENPAAGADNAVGVRGERRVMLLRYLFFKIDLIALSLNSSCKELQRLVGISQRATWHLQVNPASKITLHDVFLFQPLSFGLRLRIYYA